MLEPTGFEFALQTQLSVLRFDGHDDRGVREIEKPREQHAGLTEAVIVTLQSGQYEIEFFFLDRRREIRRCAKRIELRKIIVSDMNTAVRAFRERFFDRLLDALWAHRERDDFAAVLFLQPQRFF